MAVVTEETAAWALEQMCRLETAVRELNDKNAELERELININAFGRYLSGERIECLKTADTPDDQPAGETPRMT